MSFLSPREFFFYGTQGFGTFFSIEIRKTLFSFYKHEANGNIKSCYCEEKLLFL